MFRAALQRHRGERFARWVVVVVFVRGVGVGVWGRFVPQQIVGIGGPDRGGAVAAAMG